MTIADSTFKKKEMLLIGILAVVAMALTTVAVVPSLRFKVKDAFVSEDREILAKVNGRISPEGPEVSVLKIKSAGKLSVEVYEVISSGNVLMAKLPLFESRDGFVSLKGSATNLALADLDKDGLHEIVAPTYDEQMVPRLNIFKFNQEAKSFDRAQSQENLGEIN